MAQFQSAHGLVEQIFPLTINAGNSGDNLLVSGVPRYRLLLMMYHFMVPSAVTITMLSSGGSVISGPRAFATNGGVLAAFSRDGYIITKSGEGLVMNLSGAVLIGGEGTYGIIRSG